MGVGARVGVVVGPRVGEAVGVSADPLRVLGGGGSLTTLAVTILNSVAPVITLAPFSYAVVVTNTGGVAATSVVCDVQLDPQLTYVAAGSGGTGWSTVDMGGGLIRSTRASGSVGAMPTITINVTSPAAAETSVTTADADSSNASPATQDSESTVCNLVAVDAASGIRVPNSTTEWNNFVAYHVAIGTADFPNVSLAMLWLMQEASGNLADSSGDGFTLTAVGASLQYQQTETGWTRKSIRVAVDGNTGRLSNSAGPQVLTDDFFVYAIASMPTATPAVVRNMVMMGANATRCALELTTVPRTRAKHGANSADGSTSPLSAVRPLGLKSDRTNLTSTGYTNLAVLGPTFDALVAGQLIDFFAVAGGQAAAAMGFLYAVGLTAANARLSDANVKALWTALGWSIPW